MQSRQREPYVADLPWEVFRFRVEYAEEEVPGKPGWNRHVVGIAHTTRHNVNHWLYRTAWHSTASGLWCLQYRQHHAANDKYGCLERSPTDRLLLNTVRTGRNPCTAQQPPYKLWHRHWQFLVGLQQYNQGLHHRQLRSQHATGSLSARCECSTLRQQPPCSCCRHHTTRTSPSC